MRIAFISDIHGNGIALREALASVANRDADKLVCLGDICYGGPEPRECLRLVRERADCCVLGNTDSAILSCVRASGEDRLLKWAEESLDADDLKYLASLPLCLELPVENARIKMFHGTPSSNSEELTRGLMDELAGAPDRREAYVSGHTHIPSITHVGNACFVNPGSVGKTIHKSADGIKRSLPVARYCVLDIGKEINIEFIQSAFPLEAFKETLVKSGMPDLEKLMFQWRPDAAAR